MATKEERIKYLQKLGGKLGRDVDTTGTVAEIEQRIKELKAEVGEISEPGEEEISRHGDTVSDTQGEKQREGMVTVKARRTLHVHAVDSETGRQLEMAEAGSVVRVPAEILEALLADELVEGP